MAEEVVAAGAADDQIHDAAITFRGWSHRRDEKRLAQAGPESPRRRSQ